MVLHSLIIATLLGLNATGTGPAQALRSAPAPAGDAAPPGIRLWTSHGEVYRRGEHVRVFFRTEQDAHVTIFRVDTDGRVRVLFPREPWEENYVRGGYTYDVPNYGQHDAFVVDDDPGVGYVFGVASAEAFAYDPLTSSNHWDLQLVSDGGRIHGDPYQSLEELVQRIIPPGYTDYDTHLLPYDVERHYDYPRFVCYDCHSYVGWAAWDPYAAWCPRYTLFVYRDPFYFYPSYWYPTRYYGGTRVVYVRPADRGGAYVFKAREDQSAPAIAYRDRRTDDATLRRPADRGVRGADIGGVGSVPVPGGRRVIGDQGGGATGYQGGRTPEPRIQLIPGSAQVPGRRGEAVPSVSPDAGTPKVFQGDGGGRRAVTPANGAPQQLPRYVQPLNDRPRGVYIDPKTQTDRREPQSVPADAGRRSEPVYLGRPAQPVQGPEAKPPENRAEPRATPQTERAPEPRAAPPARVMEPRSSPPQRSAEPRSAPAPRSSEPRSAPASRSPSGGGSRRHPG
jgi:hypothetical protein